MLMNVMYVSELKRCKSIEQTFCPAQSPTYLLVEQLCFVEGTRDKVSTTASRQLQLGTLFSRSKGIYWIHVSKGICTTSSNSLIMPTDTKQHTPPAKYGTLVCYIVLLVQLFSAFFWGMNHFRKMCCGRNKNDWFCVPGLV